MRNRGAARVSNHINRHPAVNIHHATRMAKRQGTPLNWAVTINFGVAGIDPAVASQLFQRLLAQRFAPWLRRSASNDNNLPPTYVWTLEAPNGPVNGHWLLHLPDRLFGQFERRLSRWFEGLSGQPIPPRALHFQPIYNPTGMRWYALKGINPVWAKHLGVMHVPQGTITGKRSGSSRNLGPLARARAGYRPKRHQF